MARLSPSWRALRPVLLAGAAAVSWLTLSSTAATADAGPDSSSLLGGATSTVTSLTQNVAGPAPASPVDALPGTAGLLQPVVTQVSGLADDLVSSAPVVSQVAPAGTVSAIAAPVTGAADSVAADVVQVVVAPVAEAVPVLEPVVQPISDLVAGVGLPTELPDLPAAVPAPETPVPAVDAAAGALPLAAGGPTIDGVSVDGGPAAEPSAPDSVYQPGGGQGLALLAATAAGQAAPADALLDGPFTSDPAPLPAQAPPAQGSGTGAGGSPGGASGPAACPDSFDLHLHSTGAVRSLEDGEHIPAPVSYDPGSSPD